LKEYRLHRNHHSYQAGKSTETALHNLVTCIESDTEYKKSALEAFFDIEGASERTSLDEITQVTERHGTEPRWICSTLESWTIVTTLSVETLWREGMSTGGCAFASAVKPGCGQNLMGIQ
jgi:hypothetical protein